MLQVGAIYIWSYVYMIMRVYANNSIKDVNTHDSTISITLSGESAETFPETCTESLLPSRDCPSSDDHSDQVELTHTTSGGKVKVFLASITIKSNTLPLFFSTKKIFIWNLFSFSKCIPSFGFKKSVVIKLIMKILFSGDMLFLAFEDQREALLYIYPLLRPSKLADTQER